MSHPKKDNIAGTFYTVEDLMNLPEAGAVNPNKAREVSKRYPIRFWLPKDALIAILEANIAIIEFNQDQTAAVEQRQAEILVAQRRLWLEYIQDEVPTDQEEVFIAMFPASTAGDDYDDEAAIILADDVE